jgi:NAD(P)H-nitrite reductase large subunit
MDYVVIGNGVAGMTAANRIRLRDSAANITVVSKESDHFFSRTALMYVFCGQMSERDVEPFERDHYGRMRFKRVRDRVVSIDSETKRLKMKSWENIAYDRLLIASGSVPRILDCPGKDLDGVGNFVTWQNLKWMQKEAQTARKAVIVGGGLIGIEVAEILLQAGIGVSFLIRESHYWPIALDENEGMMVVDHMQHRGCDVRLKTECQEILGKEGKVAAVLTKDGETIDCDMVIFTVGVVPQTNWLEESGLEIDKTGGIVVNGHLETNLPYVWAAGDCSSVVWFNGVRRPEQLWYTARDQGAVAGLNMAGDKRVYRRGTLYNSAKFFDLEYTTAGYVNFRFEGEQNWCQREPGTDNSERITYLPDGSVIGFNMIGRRWDHRVLVRWVEEKRSLEWVLEHLHEAIFDEEFMPKFRVLQTV